jgi:hypothetical protein
LRDRPANPGENQDAEQGAGADDGEDRRGTVVDMNALVRVTDRTAGVPFGLLGLITASPEAVSAPLTRRSGFLGFTIGSFRLGLDVLFGPHVELFVKLLVAGQLLVGRGLRVSVLVEVGHRRRATPVLVAVGSDHLVPAPIVPLFSMFGRRAPAAVTVSGASPRAV